MDWEFYISLAEHPARLVMRRKVDGEWEIREPTPEEAERYEAEEAW